MNLSEEDFDPTHWEMILNEAGDLEALGYIGPAWAQVIVRDDDGKVIYETNSEQMNRGKELRFVWDYRVMPS